MQRLTEDQRASVEKLATEAGTTCEGCGSAQLRCGEEARRTHDTCGAPTTSTHGEPTYTSRSHLGRSSAPRGESYSAECVERLSGKSQ
jgi:hypothetical protein